MRRFCRCSGTLLAAAFAVLTVRFTASAAVSIAPLPDVTVVLGAPAPLIPILLDPPDVEGPVEFEFTSSRFAFIRVEELLESGPHRAVRLRIAATRPDAAEIRAGVTHGGVTRWISFQVAVVVGDFRSNGFTVPSLQATGGTWADLDRDGVLELLGTGGDPRVSQYFLRHSNGTSWMQKWFLSQDLALGSPVRRVLWTDFDGNGLVDPTFVRSNRLQLLWSFQNAQRYPIIERHPDGMGSRAVGSAAWGDLDQDGDDDLIVTGEPKSPESSGGEVLTRIYRNDRGTDFVALTAPLPGGRGPVVVADFNNDGRPDVFIGDDTGRASSEVWWNDGQFRFRPSGLKTAAIPVASAGAMDFDGDGRYDLWTLEQTPDPQIPQIRLGSLTLYRQAGDQLIPESRWDPEELDIGADPAWGDLDADGDLDFVAPRRSTERIRWTDAGAQFGNYFCVYWNQGAGGFRPGRYLSSLPTTRHPFPSLFNGVSVAVADVNGDRRLDVWSPQPSLMLTNALPGANVLPGAPEELSAAWEGDELVLRWGAAHDSSQISPLTYNLRMGTASGTGDVVAPMALDDGTRLVLADGNCGFARVRRLRLPPTDRTNLYWSVQAVDRSFAGGAWALEQQIALPDGDNQAPAIEAPESWILQEDDPKARFPVTLSDDRTQPRRLRLEATSSDPGLLGVFTRQISSSPSSAMTDPPLQARRIVELTPAPNRWGSAEVYLTVTDREGGVRSRVIRITIESVEDSPTLQEPVFLNGPKVLLAGERSVPLEIRVSDPEDAPELVALHAVSSDPLLLPESSFHWEGEREVRLLRVTPAAGRQGPVTLSFEATDSGGRTTRRDLDLFVVGHRFADSGIPFPTLISDAPQAGDFDGDGALDVFSRTPGDVLSWWRNDGGGRFTKAWERPLAGTSEHQLLVTDLDGDHRLDVLTSRLSEADEPEVTWLRNTPAGFEPVPIPVPLVKALAPVTLAAGDLDGDGDLDLLLAQVTTETRSPRLQVCEHRGGGFYPRPPTFQRLDSAERVVVLKTQLYDLDGNRIPDAVLLQTPRQGPRADRLVPARGQPGHAYVEMPSVWDPRGPLPWSTDLDGDGTLDFLQGSYGIYRSQGARPPLRLSPEGVLGPEAFPADFDNDGRTDRLGPDAIHFQDQGRPEVWVETAVGWHPGTTLIADFNGDGFLDRFGSRYEWRDGMRISAEPGVQLGRGAVPNSRPHAPGGLQAVTIAPGTVRLTWDAAVDPNQTDALSYNLRIGTSPGGGDVMPPLSLPDGTRLLVARGNVGGARRWVVSGLTPGRTYHAAVQAVDNSYAGGPFSSEQVFTVAPEIRPPVLVAGAVATNGWSLRAEGAPGERLHLETGSDLKSWSVEQWLSLDDFGEGVWHRPPGASNGPLLLLRALRP